MSTIHTYTRESFNATTEAVLSRGYRIESFSFSRARVNGVWLKRETDGDVVSVTCDVK